MSYTPTTVIQSYALTGRVRSYAAVTNVETKAMVAETVSIAGVFLKGDPAGPGGGASIEHPIYLDASRPLAYVGYTNRIVRMDYTNYPPTLSTFTTGVPSVDWPNRTTLEYA